MLPEPEPEQEEENVHPQTQEIENLLSDLIESGFQLLRVYDGGESYTKGHNNELLQAILSVEISHLFVYHETTGAATLCIVLGNEPGIAVCDYSCRRNPEVLDEVIQKQQTRD